MPGISISSLRSWMVSTASIGARPFAPGPFESDATDAIRPSRTTDGTVCFDAMRQYGAVDGQIRTRTVVLEIVAEVVPVSLFKIAPVIMAVTIHACSIHAMRLLA